LAVLFRRPVREIAAWPAWEVRLLEEFLVKEPAGIERLEILAARFAAQYFNFHSSDASAKYETTDFLHFHHAFRQTHPDLKDGRYSELDLEVFAALNR
jgi:hypothetical protein